MNDKTVLIEDYNGGIHVGLRCKHCANDAAVIVFWGPRVHGAVHRVLSANVMTFEIMTEPVDRWPLADTVERKWPNFSAKYAATEDLLTRELGMIGARGKVVLQVVTRNGASDIRRDGMLRAQAKIEHPGVRLSFESDKGPLTYATDLFDGNSWRPGWQQNLRAIALGLEALRKIERYGIARSDEQYRGWLAIESGPAKLTEQQALGVFRSVLGAFDRSSDVNEMYRRAKAATHPDHNGGLRGPWDDVERAAKALGLI